jgi:hypothetical protein
MEVNIFVEKMLQMSPRLMVDETGTVIKLCKTTEIANIISEVKSRNRGKLPDNHQAIMLYHLMFREKCFASRSYERGMYLVEWGCNGKF